MRWPAWAQHTGSTVRAYWAMHGPRRPHPVAWVRDRPILTQYLFIAAWSLLLSFAVYHFARADQARARRQRGVLVATANQQICNAINTKVLTPARASLGNNAASTAKLLGALGFNHQQVAAFLAAQKAPIAKQRKLFADIDCTKLATSSDAFAPQPKHIKPVPSTVPRVPPTTTNT